MKNYYNLFCLKYKTNNDKELADYNLTHFNCYDTNIVYGDSLTFEGYILRTNFMDIVDRGNNRPYYCIIIDKIVTFEQTI